MDTTHLDALNLRLSNERVRLSNAKTKQERELRTVWVKQIEKEVELETRIVFGCPLSLPAMSDDELLAALTEKD